MDVPTRIEVEERSRVILTWDDGTETRWTAAELRGVCQCASCREPVGAEQTAAVLGGPVPVTISEARLVGGYAVSFVFGPDGHGTGIYPFESLRSRPETAGGDPDDPAA